MLRTAKGRSWRPFLAFDAVLAESRGSAGQRPTTEKDDLDEALSTPSRAKKGLVSPTEISEHEKCFTIFRLIQGQTKFENAASESLREMHVARTRSRAGSIGLGTLKSEIQPEASSSAETMQELAKRRRKN